MPGLHSAYPVAGILNTVTIPAGNIAAPPLVARIAAGRPVKAVWDNEAGGRTFQIGHGADREFVKVAPPHPSIDLRAEADRLSWAAPYLTVPTVLGLGHDGTTDWLHTTGVPGRSAVEPYWVERPQQAVAAVGAGLRMLHDRLPADRCPYSWSVADRLARVRPAKRRELADPPPVDRFVVCHGDACAPNTLIDDDGRCSGHVDLGELGVADRWADLAVATLSLGWNYPGDWEDDFFAAYGVTPDPQRIAYYRLLWDSEDDSG